MQLTFSDLSEQNKKVVTKKAKFLNEMEQVVPWQAFIDVIKPHYHKTYNPKGGRKAYPLETMLRIYFLQQWYSLSDAGTEDFIYDIHTATVTSANESDVGQMPKLLRKSDEVIMGDAGYTGEKHKKKAREEGKSF